MEAERASTEVRQRRVAKRVEGVRAIMRTPAYIVVLCSRLDRPPAPDPHDESTSKRAWERKMQLWRHDLRSVLRQIHAEGV